MSLGRGTKVIVESNPSGSWGFDEIGVTLMPDSSKRFFNSAAFTSQSLANQPGSGVDGDVGSMVLWCACWLFLPWISSGCSGGKGGQQEVADLAGLREAAGSGGSTNPLFGVAVVVNCEVAPPEAVIAPEVVALVGRLNPE